MIPTQHTPGPWHVHTDKTYPFVVLNSKGQQIATTGGNIYIDPSFHVANARLISAAPDLLNALEQIAKETKDNPHPAMVIFHRLAQQAINKAKGE